MSTTDHLPKGKTMTDADDRTAMMRRTTLRNIDSTAGSIKRALQEIQKDAAAAIVALETGMTMRGTLSSGPIGHQGPSDVIALSARLTELLNTALMLECSDEDIRTAYNQS